MTHPLHKAQNLMTHPPHTFWPVPYLARDIFPKSKCVHESWSIHLSLYVSFVQVFDIYLPSSLARWSKPRVQAKIDAADKQDTQQIINKDKKELPYGLCS